MFHDVLHGFWAGCGMGTTAIEAKLTHNLAAMREAVIFEVFLDLQNSCDALDRNRCLNILVAYSVVPRAIRILGAYWVRLTNGGQVRQIIWPPL